MIFSGAWSDSMNDIIGVILSKVSWTGGFLADSPQSAETHAPNGGKST
jgi:hypothetical protein